MNNIPQYAINDVKFGVDKEEELHDFFNSYFECEFKTTSHFSHIDYISESKKIIIELKSRRCKYDTYSTTMISVFKIKSLLKKVEMGYSVYLFFNFDDGLFFYVLDRFNKDWVQSGGRMDRGKFEYKHMGYYYIPICQLHNVDLSDELPKENPVLKRQDAMGQKSLIDYFNK